MKSMVRFGSRIRLPSTIEIKHELRAMAAEWNVRELCAEAEGLPATASWDELEAHRLAHAHVFADDAKLRPPIGILEQLTRIQE
jgi:hypothetical protein